ncbi:XrtA/PEP-CTERM system-associated ATPase [Trichloromonas sp.]|uniref:XrtA/PEP-CTERM system-associated ATPase n=1 Tax=Trichloromonas sp. TaxID=3069249 RepID=UPI003D81B035
MYESYFGLNTKPFELVPNPRFLFNSQSHKKAINYLKYGLQERAGFILLTGEVGSGKTTIIRDIINNLEADIALSMVFNTRVTSKQVIAMINEDFGLEVVGKDKVALVRDLNDHLIGLHARQKRAVVIVDEAQNLTPTILEEIRLLSNLEADSFKLLQIILVGQPELKKIITCPELRQLRQRISIHCHLQPLTREESEAYVYHRLAMAGNRNALRWNDGTFDILYGYSGGIPRLINVFCDFVLLAAFVEGTRELTRDLVDEVIGDVSWDRHLDSISPSPGQRSVTGDDQEGMADRLLRFEQRLNCLDAVQEGDGWIAKRLAVQADLLNRLAERHSGDIGRIESALARICRQLDGLIASSAAAKDATGSSTKPLDAAVDGRPTSPTPAASASGALPKKRLFGRRG